MRIIVLTVPVVSLSFLDLHKFLASFGPRTNIDILVIYRHLLTHLAVCTWVRKRCLKMTLLSVLILSLLVNQIHIPVLLVGGYSKHFVLHTNSV